MANYYIVFDRATGEVRWRAEGDAAAQQLPEGLSALPLPDAALTVAEIDLAAVKASLLPLIDAQCGAIRRQFITDITGQEATYQLKLAEARSWTAELAPSAFPYLSREATKRDMPLADLVDEVLSIGALWIGAIDPELESSRVAAKKGVSEATTVPQALIAGSVDWTAVLAIALDQA